MTSDLHPTLQLTGRDPMGGMKSGHEAARGGVAGGMGCMLHAFAGHQRSNGACQPKVAHPGGPVLPGVATDEPLQAAPRQRQCRGPVVERMVDPIEMCQRHTTQARVGRQGQCGRRGGARKRYAGLVDSPPFSRLDLAPVLARWHAPPSLGAVRAAQEEAAVAEGAFFWNAAAAMAAGEGAACAIHTWVLAEPPLAYSDHVHLTPAGAERLAARFWEALMGPYEAAQCRARGAGNALF